MYKRVSPRDLSRDNVDALAASAAEFANRSASEDPMSSTPVEIVFHHVDRSANLELAIREQAAKLEKFADGITNIRVTVDRPHARHQQGTLFEVRVDVRIGATEIVAGRDHGNDHSHEDVYIAVADAFAAARRRVQDFSRIRQAVR